MCGSPHFPHPPQRRTSRARFTENSTWKTDFNDETAGRGQPGVIGNLNGRPWAPATLSVNAFLTDLADVWAEYGKSACSTARKTQPEAFFATCARSDPKTYRSRLSRPTQAA